MKFFIFFLVFGTLNAQNDLLHYWSFDDNLNDQAGTANVVKGENYKFVNDRLDNPNSAVYLNKGYLVLPDNLQMPNEFTITAWVNYKSKMTYQRIIDFGNGDSNDNIVFYMQGSSTKVGATIYTGRGIGFEAIRPSELELNKWYHLAFVISNKVGIIYVNGKAEASATVAASHNNLSRNKNYIGKSNWSWDGLADAIYDDIKIYNRALCGSEIENEYNS